MLHVLSLISNLTVPAVHVGVMIITDERRTGYVLYRVDATPKSVPSNKKYNKLIKIHSRFTAVKVPDLMELGTQSKATSIVPTHSQILLRTFIIRLCHSVIGIGMEPSGPLAFHRVFPGAHQPLAYLHSHIRGNPPKPPNRNAVR